MIIAELTDPDGPVAFPLGMKTLAPGPSLVGKDGLVCTGSSHHRLNPLSASSGALCSFRVWNATGVPSRGCDLRSGALPCPRDGVLGREGSRRDWKAGTGAPGGPASAPRRCARPRPACAPASARASPASPLGPELRRHAPLLPRRQGRHLQHQGRHLQRLPETHPHSLLPSPPSGPAAGRTTEPPVPSAEQGPRSGAGDSSPPAAPSALELRVLVQTCPGGRAAGAGATSRPHARTDT